jgi:putative transposase
MMQKKDIVYLDESGIEDNCCLNYGFSKVGERCYGQKALQHNHRISMIAGLCNNKIMAPAFFDGYCDANVFETYVEHILIKALKPGQTIVMDNINFHKTEKVKLLIESVGCQIIYLPTYSPDLNPIEHHWFKIKNHIKKIAHTFDNFVDAISLTLNHVSI